METQEHASSKTPTIGRIGTLRSTCKYSSQSRGATPVVAFHQQVGEDHTATTRVFQGERWFMVENPRREGASVVSSSEPSSSPSSVPSMLSISKRLIIGFNFLAGCGTFSFFGVCCILGRG